MFLIQLWIEEIQNLLHRTPFYSPPSLLLPLSSQHFFLSSPYPVVSIYLIKRSVGRKLTLAHPLIIHPRPRSRPIRHFPEFQSTLSPPTTLHRPPFTIPPRIPLTEHVPQLEAHAGGGGEGDGEDPDVYDVSAKFCLSESGGRKDRRGYIVRDVMHFGDWGAV